MYSQPALEPFKHIKTTATGVAAKKRIYITGKVTGLPYEEVKRKFQQAENYLTTLGLKAINPTKLIGEDCPWPEAMKACIRDLCTCDAIYLLKDYHKSNGAMLEHAVAAGIGLEIIHEY